MMQWESLVPGFVLEEVSTPRPKGTQILTFTTSGPEDQGSRKKKGVGVQDDERKNKNYSIRNLNLSLATVV